MRELTVDDAAVLIGRLTLENHRLRLAVEDLAAKIEALEKSPARPTLVEKPPLVMTPDETPKADTE